LFSLGILCAIRHSAADDVSAAAAAADDVSTDWWTESAGVCATAAAATTTATMSNKVNQTKQFVFTIFKGHRYKTTIIPSSSWRITPLESCFTFWKKNVAAKPSRYNDNNILLI
jgi:hypothetical protein